MTDRELSRRDLLAGAAGLVGGAILAGVPSAARGQQGAPVPPPLPPGVPADPTKIDGAPTSAVGHRSPFVTPARAPVGKITGSSFTPLDQLTGTITPSDLHFERHHAGVPLIDPSRHTLLIHGLVERPLVFNVEDFKRFPQVTRTHFLECSGNGRSAYHAPTPDMNAQVVAGLLSQTEWMGVPLKLVLAEAGPRADASWILAEGGDACLLTRSIPMTKAMDDALIVWGQNGEPLRPEQGFPLRLLVPGWEGNANVKWLRRLELGTAPSMTRWETSTYTDPLANGTARQFSFELDAKSVITTPTHPATLIKGWWNVGGLAWSGRGVVRRVEVSTDGGAHWTDAVLQGTPLPKALVRFNHPWEWDSRECVLLSRATDETGYVQPTRTELIKVRGIGTDYHFNQIVGWRVAANGQTFFHGET